jgi:hypothetical protein
MARKYNREHPFSFRALYDFIVALKQRKGEDFEMGRGRPPKWYREIIEERINQDEKWGQQNYPPCKFLTILGEEYGEACKAALEAKYEEYREELVQVAAVAVQMIEALDRAEAKARVKT